MTRAPGRALLLLALALSAACTPRYFRSRAFKDWPGAFGAAYKAVEAGRHAQADSILGAFAARHPRSPEARESLYWRALFRLDPGNPSGSALEAGTLLGRYLADSALPRRAEATLLHRNAIALDSRPRQLVSVRASLHEANTALAALKQDSTARAGAAAVITEEELQRLQTELANTKAELDRLRKRLTTRRP